MRADLHLHTRCSDGAQTPAEMVRRARAAGMDVIAITDHDAVAGVNEARKAGQAEGILVLPGVELSVGLGREIHMLGYGVNPDDEETRAFFAHEIEMRRERTLAMIEKLEWMDAGLAGIEAWHASHSLDEGERFEALARANGLLVTGGSDCHGRPSDGRQPDGSRGGHAGIGEDLDGWKHVREDVEALCARIKEQKD